MGPGRLYVELVGARGLLPADGLTTDGASARDPYGELRVNTSQRQRSKTRRHTRDPDFEFNAEPFPVPHPSSVLHVHIYDAGDILHSDELLGCAQVELRHLPWNTPVDVWLELSNDQAGHPSSFVSKKPGSAAAGASGSSEEMATEGSIDGRKKRVHSTSRGATAIPDVPGLPSAARVRHPFGIIQLRLMYKTSWLCIFTSGFRPAPPREVLVPPPFHATTCYTNLMRCLEYTNPLLEGAEEVSKIQRWVSPLKSMSVLLAWILVMRYSDSFPVVLHLWLLFKMAAGYVGKYTSDHPHGVYRVDKIRRRMAPLPRSSSAASAGGALEGEASKEGLSGFVDASATWLLGIGLGAQLETAQNAMGTLADGLDAVADIFSWRDLQLSRNVCAGLFASGTFLYLFPTRWLLLCVTMWLMLSTTMLYSVVLRGLTGLSGLLARSPSADAMMKDGQIQGLLKVKVRGIAEERSKPTVDAKPENRKTR